MWFRAIGAAALSLCVTQGAAMGPYHTDSLLSQIEPNLLQTETVGSMAPPENRRGMAIALAVLLGPFGAHRLYLGTTPKVAIAYGLTFGGFGVVALIDLIQLIAAKDLVRFQDCDRILMWAGEPTPP
ncbi:MAG: TM2 domain-containing protein [Flavobacteriales bacterium]|nr:TM2 domain-containing protein [Flavobacteriales bacterium]